MTCMKCGRDVEEGQVFCGICREVMEKYPVKPGIAILLPHQKEAPPPRKAPARRRLPTLEEQIHRLKRWVRNLLLLWLLTLLLLAATIYPTVEYFFGETLHQTGQNYSTMTETRPANSRNNYLP